MKNVSKLVVRMGLLSLLSVMSLTAQIVDGVDFTTPFPFLRMQRQDAGGLLQNHPVRYGCKYIADPE
jgi:hypothetical protein